MCILNETIVINIYVYTFVNIYFTLNLVYAIAYKRTIILYNLYHFKDCLTANSLKVR